MIASTPMHWDFAIILLLLGVAVPWLGYRRVRRLINASSITTLERLTLYASTLTFQWVLAGVILWRAHERGVSAFQLGIGMPHPLLAISISIVLSLLLLMNQLVAIRRLATQADQIRGVLPQLAMKIFPQNVTERLVFFALVSTVAVCEELIYRGFVQYVFQTVFGGLAVAGIALSAILFSAAHAYQGRRGLISTLFIGVIFSSVRVWTGTLVPSISAHFVTDLVVGLSAPTQLRGALARHSEPDVQHTTEIVIC